MTRLLPLGLALALSAGCQRVGEDVGHTWFLHTGGADLRVRVEGNLASGKALLVLHGGPQGNSHQYNVGRYAEALEAEYAMVYFDQRGQGGSHGTFSRDDVDAQRLADDAADMVRAVKAKYGDDLDVWLFGHSWGGALGTMTLVDTDIQPQVAGWIEASGCHDDILGFTGARDMYRDIGDAEIEAGRNVSDWESFQAIGADEDLSDGVSWEVAIEMNQAAYQAEALIDAVAEPDFGTADILSQTFGSPIRSSVANWSGRFTLLDAKYELADLSYADRVDEITVPSLFLYGTYDFVCPSVLGREALANLGTSDAAFVEMTASGHSTMLNEPEAFTEAVIDFVNAH